jgi:hypothetical protein
MEFKSLSSTSVGCSVKFDDESLRGELVKLLDSNKTEIACGYKILQEDCKPLLINNISKLRKFITIAKDETYKRFTEELRKNPRDFEDFDRIIVYVTAEEYDRFYKNRGEIKLN